MNKASLQHLGVTILAQENLTVIQSLSHLAADTNCFIYRSQMSDLGDHFGLVAALSGSWDAIAKFETGLKNLEKKNPWLCTSKRLTPVQYENPLIPYRVQVLAQEDPNLLQKVSQFFNPREITITDAQLSTYTTQRTQTPMLTLNMSVLIPHTLSSAELRESFILYCDRFNYDAVLEPDD